MIHLNYPKGNRAHRQEVTLHPFPDLKNPKHITPLPSSSAKQRLIDANRAAGNEHTI